MPTVSVLVPIYNVEPYLRQCIDSLLRQTFADIEIILLDDGSMDGSSAIADEAAQADARVRVVHKQNSGYGDTLNKGLKVAAGEWIAIVEPDDWAEPTMVADLLDTVRRCDTPERPVDMVKGSYYRVINNIDGSVVEMESVHSSVVQPAKQPFAIDECTDLLHLHPSIWTALYRRSFLDEFGIRFRPVPGAGWTDNPFFLETVVAARSIVWCSKPIYHYREFEDGTLSHLQNWHVIIDRWDEMCEVLDRYDVHIPNVLEAHACRGCAYLQMLHEDFEQTDELIKAARAMAATIDFDLVRGSSLIPKRYKFAYGRYLSNVKRANLLVSWLVMHAHAALDKGIQSSPKTC